MSTTFEAGQSGLVLLVPEVEPVVGTWRGRHEPTTAFGVPAHITVLFPFLPADDLDDGVLAELRRLFATVESFDLRLARFGRFPEGVLYLEPDPAAPCRRLTDLVAGRWPDHQPYAGAYGQVVPHLTVTVNADPSEEAAVEAAVGPQLPLRARIDRVALMCFDGTSWRDRASFPLGANGGTAAASH